MKFTDRGADEWVKEEQSFSKNARRALRQEKVTLAKEVQYALDEKRHAELKAKGLQRTEAEWAEYLTLDREFWGSSEVEEYE